MIEGLAPRGDEGSSCLCYIVRKKEDNNKIVLLKELYPANQKQNSEMERDTENNQLKSDQITTEKWNKFRERFEKAIQYIQYFKNEPDTERFICAEKDIEPLYGYGTVYCENKFCGSAVSWREDIEENGVKVDEVLQTAIGVHKFMKLVHKRKLAYVDLKPDDILLPKSRIGNIDNELPLFYDFNSMLEMGLYSAGTGIVNGTKEYMPPQFKNRSKNDMLSVDLNSERYTYAAVLQSIIKEKMQTLSYALKSKLEDLFDELMKSEGEQMDEEELEETLKEIRQEVQDNEYENEYKRLPGRTKWFHLIHFLIMILAIGLHIATGLFIAFLCFRTDKASFLLFEKYHLFLWKLILVMIGDVVVLNGLKILSMKLAQIIANSTISCHYYKTDIKNGNYNTFRLGKRKNTTFQDTHQSNVNRQRLRHVLWPIVCIALLATLVLSMPLISFPVFISIGCLVVLVFMYVDCIPSISAFFRNYAKIYGIPDLEGSDGRAAVYYEEYDETGKTFDLNQELYQKNRRNLFQIREAVCEESFENAQYYPAGAVNRIRWYFDYKYRSARVDHFKMKGAKERSLQFPALEIKHIYKMRFDRMRNLQLILSVVVALVTLSAVFMGIGYYSEPIREYFHISEPYYLWVVLGLLFGATLVNCYQIAFSLRDELFIADMSYKSKYIIDNPEQILNDLLIKDIAAGFIKPIDISRGIWQYSGYMFTVDDPAFIKSLGLREEDMDSSHASTKVSPGSIELKNRHLLHHTFIGAQSRIAITVWLTCAILFSVFVWLLKIYWMFPALLIVSPVIHLYSLKVWLPRVRTERIKKMVEALKSKLEL